MRDLSASGAFIETASRVPLFQLLHVDFGHGVGSCTGLHSVPAYVVRASSAGIGIEWCAFATQAIRSLLRSAKVSDLTFEHHEEADNFGAGAG